MANRIVIVYDNIANEQNPKLIPGWGFAAYIEWDGKRVLFDTGWDGKRLLNNLHELQLRSDSFDAIFITHMHWDHAGGLPDVLAHAKIKQIYLPKGFSENQGREIEKYGPQIIYVEKFGALTDISPNIFSTGSLKVNGPIEEQAMILQEADPASGSKYTRMIVGCSHPGLAPFYEVSSSLGDIHEVIGGVHGFKDGSFIANHHTKRLFIGHCTQHKTLFSGLSGIDYHDLHVGQKIL